MIDNTEVSARLTLVVEYFDIDMPDASDVEEILDAARNYGRIKQATFETLKSHKKELV